MAPTEPESGRDAGRASGELRLGTPPTSSFHHFLAQSAKLPLKAFPVWLPSPIYTVPQGSLGPGKVTRSIPLPPVQGLFF